MNIIDTIKPEQISEFETPQCHVGIYKTLVEIAGERLYLVSSTRKLDGRTSIRYGNKCQTQAIIRTYTILGSKNLEIKW